jgi:single-stranded-DNA-specific exonuclease
VAAVPAPIDWLLDWRGLASEPPTTEAVLQITDCPTSWDELGKWLRQAQQTQQKLALAYRSPSIEPPTVLWQQFVEIAESLSQSGGWIEHQALQQNLGLGEPALQIGCKALEKIGFQVHMAEHRFQIQRSSLDLSTPDQNVDNPDLVVALQQFFRVVQEEQFRRQYFYQTPLATIQTVAEQMIGSLSSS